MIRNWHRRLGATLALATVMGCDMPPAEQVAPVPAPAIIAQPTRPVPQIQPVQTVSEKSLALKAYYKRVMTDAQTRGLLRTDGGGPDTPFTVDMLMRNFERIAFFNEYTRGQVNLRRWQAPVTIKTHFGASIPANVRARDGAAVQKYASRLARITGHPISSTPRNDANFHVFFVSEDDRPAAVEQIRLIEPGIDNATLRLIANMPRANYCLVVAFTPAGMRSIYTRAVAIIRAEQPDLMRLSCIHEEIAQGLGLPNDFAEARPSIFNDDDEFSLLTTHDEHLLRILYDPRLKVDMTAREAMPIARQIALEDLAARF